MVPGILPAASLFAQALILQLLDFVFIVLFVQLVARIFRNQLPTLLTALLLLVSGSLATLVIEPLQKIAQWLPSTYFNTLKIVSGTTAYEMNKAGINFASGVVTLIIGTAILLLAMLLLDRATIVKHKSEASV